MSILIQTLDLFQVLDRVLIELFSSLSPNDWSKPTFAKLLTVNDVAAHSLDTICVQFPHQINTIAHPKKNGT